MTDSVKAAPLLDLDALVERLGGGEFFHDDGGKQEQKSLATRRRVLTATIECLAHHGYAQTTTPMIARAARMSRGAMLHHYTTRAELIEATIDFICVIRLQNFIEAMRGLTEHERVGEMRALEINWEGFLSIEFQAFMELQIAARTDVALRALFEPKARRFDAVLHEMLPRIFPEWSDMPERLETAIDFCMATFQGLILNRRIFEPGARRVAVLHLFAATMQAYRNGEIVPARVLPSEAAAEDAGASRTEEVSAPARPRKHRNGDRAEAAR